MVVPLRFWVSGLDQSILFDLGCDKHSAFGNRVEIYVVFNFCILGRCHSPS